MKFLVPLPPPLDGWSKSRHKKSFFWDLGSRGGEETEKNFLRLDFGPFVEWKHRRSAMSRSPPSLAAPRRPTEKAGRFSCAPPSPRQAAKLHFFGPLPPPSTNGRNADTKTFFWDLRKERRRGNRKKTFLSPDFGRSSKGKAQRSVISRSPLSPSAPRRITEKEGDFLHFPPPPSTSGQTLLFRSSPPLDEQPKSGYKKVFFRFPLLPSVPNPKKTFLRLDFGYSLGGGQKNEKSTLFSMIRR